jgi:hypothetical protein
MIRHAKLFSIMSEFNHRNEWIDKYCNGELEGEELDRFEKLLRNNRELKEEVEIERQLNDAFSNPDLIEFRKIVLKVKTRQETVFWKRRFLIAAAIIILVTSGFIIWFLTSSGASSPDLVIAPVKTNAFQSDTPDTSVTQNEKPPRHNKHRKNEIPITSEVLAECMRPYPYLEGLIGEETRSMDFILISPEYRSELKPGDSLCFQWITASSSMIHLEIVDNKGDQVGSQVTVNPKCMCYATTGYPKGLYYWKLIRSNELLCVGRFVLR